MKSGKLLLSLLIITLAANFYSCGKQNLSCNASIDCSTVTYSGTIKSLVDTKCSVSGCHSSFSTYNGIKTVAENGSMYQMVVVNESMPAGNIDMSCEQRAQIECWLNAGSPNN